MDNKSSRRLFLKCDRSGKQTIRWDPDKEIILNNADEKVQGSIEVSKHLKFFHTQ
ncbi:MAG: hypothetical protein WC384_15285 [Prolixibacteraceae bacterium]|jgi:hypothetical protein